MSKYKQTEKWDFYHQLMFKYMHVFKYKIITLSSNWAFLIRYIKETSTMKLLMLQFNYKPFYMPVHLHYYFCCHSWSVACCLMQFTMLYFLYKKNFHSFCLSAIYGKAWTHKRWYITVIKVEEKIWEQHCILWKPLWSHTLKGGNTYLQETSSKSNSSAVILESNFL